MTKRFFAFVFASAALFFEVFALPGVDSYLPDTSGEYVYYKDNTFARESYIGFLFYDESAYSARYYAPANTEKMLPEKDVAILLSVNPNSGYMDFTGERFLTTLTPEDTDIINYLHDVMYEFTARRQKLKELSPDTVKKNSFAERGLLSNEEYLQFGGSVQIYFDYLVPVFNVRKILSSDGKIMLETVSAGLLVSSEDKSFANFKGIPETTVDSAAGEKLSETVEKNLVELTFSTAVQSVELDSLWQAPVENLWFLGNEASVSLSEILISTTEKSKYIEMLKRRLLLGTEGSYSLWKNFSLEETSPGKICVTGYYMHAKSGSLTRDLKIITEISDSSCGYFSLTVFDNTYRKNHKYFDSIVKSYKISK